MESNYLSIWGLWFFCFIGIPLVLFLYGAKYFKVKEIKNRFISKWLGRLAFGLLIFYALGCLYALFYERGVQSEEKWSTLLNASFPYLGVLAFFVLGLYFFLLYRSKVLAVEIFISYSRKDNLVVGLIRQDLEAQGYHVWQDTTNLPFGKAFKDNIQKGIEKADLVLAVITPDSLASYWVAMEAALSLEKTDGTYLALNIMDLEDADFFWNSIKMKARKKLEIEIETPTDLETEYQTYLQNLSRLQAFLQENNYIRASSYELYKDNLQLLFKQLQEGNK